MYRCTRRIGYNMENSRCPTIRSRQIRPPAHPRGVPKTVRGLSMGRARRKPRLSRNFQIAARISNHLLRIYDAVELLRANQPRFQRCVAKCRVLVHRTVRNRRGFVIPDDWTEGGHEHKRLIDIFADASPIKRDSLNAVLTKLDRRVAENAGSMQHVVDDDRPHRVQLEVALRSSESN